MCNIRLMIGKSVERSWKPCNHMKMFQAKFKPAIGLTILASVILTTACSGRPYQDPRITLCQDLSKLLFELPAESKLSYQKKINNLAHANIIVSFDSSHLGSLPNPSKLTCQYPYDIPAEDNAMDHADPLQAFSTSPSKLFLNNRQIPKQITFNAVHQAMKQQAKVLLAKTKRTMKAFLRQY